MTKSDGAQIDDPDFCREILRHWFSDTTKITSVRGVNHVQLGIVIGLTAHTHHLASVALDLRDRGQNLACVPLIRQSLECAITALWTALLPDAWAGLLNEFTSRQRVLGKDLLRTVDDPEKIEEVLRRLGGSHPTTATGAHIFEQRCLDIENGGQAYPMYRMLSQYSHAGTRVADAYIRMSKDGLGTLSFSKEPGADAPALVSVLTTALVLSGLAEDKINRNHPRRRFVREKATQIGITPYPKLSEKALARLGKAGPS